MKALYESQASYTACATPLPHNTGSLCSMRAHAQGVCESRIAIRLNYSSLLLQLITRPMSRKEKPCWLPFILDTKAEEMINLSPGYLLEGCHLGRKEASCKPAVSKRKETSLSHTVAALSRCGPSYYRQVSLWETIKLSASIFAFIYFL